MALTSKQIEEGLESLEEFERKVRMGPRSAYDMLIKLVRKIVREEMKSLKK